VKEIISSMQKGKIPRPNGFSIEFFLGFNDLLREYLLRIVKQSQRTGNILGSPNSTFLCLITKNKECYSFGDYRPISFCSAVYKIISKIIVVRLKPFLSETIGDENFGFYTNAKSTMSWP
jgi:hypothetical protein